MPATETIPTSGLHRSDLDGLGVRVHEGGGTLRVWSQAATSVELVVFDDDDLDWAVEETPLEPVGGGVWQVSSPSLTAGVRYALRVDGPHGHGDAFNPRTLLLDPYARAVVSGGVGDHRSAVVASAFDWQGVPKPRVPRDQTVIYEAHLKGLTKRHPGIPASLHGTYAGLGHPVMIEHLRTLGVTSIELLPIHAFESEPRLLSMGLSNYWGYNSLSYFAPHAAYATAAARQAGPTAVLDELKQTVKSLHEAGLEVILDVVYNHTAELDFGGPRSSLRGIDNRAYYRQGDDGAYIDVTGCGNALNSATDAAARLVLDSLRFWSSEVQIDGFRFDLAVTLGRDADHVFRSDHPLLRAIADDPLLRHDKLIAEPWDVGLGGWQTGAFGPGWQEWNDRYRDGIRNFWLSDIEYMRRAEASPAGVGTLATRLAGSAPLFDGRGPLAGVNFVTAHDGFTLNDLVSYEIKHNEANGEQGRDGAETNRSFNHGAEGPTDAAGVQTARRRAMRNLMGTLLLSAGTPMITAGDEFGRSQEGNNNAYCHDSTLTWLSWDHEQWQEDLRDHVSTLLRLRRENPALRPSRFAEDGRRVEGAAELLWFDQSGRPMTHERWTDAEQRTLQLVATSASEDEDGKNATPNRVLVIVHGREADEEVVLPAVDGTAAWVPLWSSQDERPAPAGAAMGSGATLVLRGPAVLLLRAG